MYIFSLSSPATPTPLTASTLDNHPPGFMNATTTMLNQTYFIPLLPIVNFLLLNDPLLVGSHQLLTQRVELLLHDHFGFVGRTANLIIPDLSLQLIRKRIQLHIQSQILYSRHATSFLRMFFWWICSIPLIIAWLFTVVRRDMICISSRICGSVCWL